MAVIAIMFWSSVAMLAIGWTPFIPRFCRWVEAKLDKRKSPGCAGTQTKGCRKMTDVVYQIREGMSR